MLDTFEDWLRRSYDAAINAYNKEQDKYADKYTKGLPGTEPKDRRDQFLAKLENIANETNAWRVSRTDPEKPCNKFITACSNGLKGDLQLGTFGTYKAVHRFTQNWTDKT